MNAKKELYRINQEDTESKHDSIYQVKKLSSCSSFDNLSAPPLMTSNKQCAGCIANPSGCFPDYEESIEAMISSLVSSNSYSGLRESAPSNPAVEKISLGDNDSILRDIVKNAQKEMRRIASSKEMEEPPADLLFRAIDSFTHPFYIIDINDYTIKMANTAAGIKRLDAGTTCYSIIHRSSVPCWKKGHDCPITQIKSTKKPIVLEHMHFDESGNQRFVEVHAYPIMDSDGEVVQIIEYGFDITEQKWVEDQLARESRRARLYLDLLAHDMANELQVIHGSAELAKEMLSIENESEMIPRFVNQIVESVNRCMTLITKARSTENLALAPLVERSLSRALMDCTEIIGENFTNCILEFEGIDIDAIVMADKYLEDLIINMISNAVEHNPSTMKKVWVKLCHSNDGFEISFSDNGPGIEDAMKEILFDPKHRMGGLGIHFSKQIIEKYGGRIYVRDRIHRIPNEGVDFVIWLPQFQRSELYVNK